MDWIARLDVIVLALMLAYAVVVVTHLYFRYYLARRRRNIDTCSRIWIKLAADLSAKADAVKSIGYTAPYLGLAGTCFGILNMFRGFDLEKHAVQVMMASIAGAALVTTAAGILVATTATCFYNYLRVRIDSLGNEVSDESLAQRSRYARRPLTKQFSELPAFALIAAPGLAIVVVSFMSFLSFQTPKGLDVELASNCCEYDGHNRMVALRITDAGKLFLNQEQQDWNGLGGRLSEIYGKRVHHTLYVFAEDGVPFQAVADAIDIARNAPITGGDTGRIMVRLITRKSTDARHPESM